MKKTIILFCSIIITTTAFAQINTTSAVKSNTRTVNNSALTKQNVAVAVINTNRDSIEISQLYEAYKMADAEATYKLQLIIAKMKEVQAKNNANETEQERADREMKMVQLRSLMENRTNQLKLTTNILSSMNQGLNTISQNLK
jgi:NhaP-type Na+/H+ and K+/H+ antiporter